MPTEINWREKLICATRWNDDASHILYIDENGHSNMKRVIECYEDKAVIQDDEKYFNNKIIYRCEGNPERKAYRLGMR
jgi:hypothetical protein